ncbi:hypothetical protein GN958_ATG20851 [Phytophthora infestans]|uniref:JmjC domain-containing protein n=1 Tax=Phytophthora infestans TaxID=4787 RepID=A0A8S9TTA6_PHYIN|nr:hypothetical protein GN958_ATG20851 [Phytophthora infestans]
MAATGLGADSPSPRALPLLTASPAFEEGDKNDYRADDEKDFGSEVDNGFDFTPSANISSAASETSEDVKGDAEKKAEDDEEEQIMENVLLGLDGDVTEKALADASAVQKVDVARHTAVQDTIVVKKYTQAVRGDESSKHSTELVAVSVSTSSAVVNQETSLTLASRAIPSDGEQDSSNEDVDMDVKIPEEILFPSDDDESDDIAVEASETAEKTNEEEKLVTDDFTSKNSLCQDSEEVRGGKSGGHEEAQEDAPASSDSDVAVIQSHSPAHSEPSLVPAATMVTKARSTETPLPLCDALAGTHQEPAELTEISSSKENGQADEDMEIDEIVDEAPQSAENEATEAELQPPAQQSQPETRPKRSTPAKTGSPSTTPAAQPSSSENPPRDESASALNPDSGSSPKRPRKRTVAPVHTPKQSKQAASKRRKTLPVSVKAGEFGAETLLPLRRSSRIKAEPPKFALPAQQLSDATVMTHFGRKADNGMACKHCGKEFTVSRGLAARHLQDCPALASHEKTAAALPAPPTTAPTHAQSAKPTREASDQLVQLMGSGELASKVKESFLGSPFSGHAPVSRFLGLIRNDVSGLRHLNVQNLLDAIDADDGPAVQLHPKLPGVRRSTGSHVLEPVSSAKARDLEKCSLRFPAPRGVAEHFITPLAKELGLEYAMARHTAKIVSCPQEETVLDWQFHRSETVIFQLSGKSLWRTKKSSVDYPVDCFHPASWQLEDVAQIAKGHCLSSTSDARVGFLAPPSGDFDVFDENATMADVSGETQKHLLKSGSVLYLPAGVWFETETQGANSLWLEVQLDSFTYEELVLSAVKQLALSGKQWRMRVQLCPGDRHQIQQARHHAEGCIQSLCKEMKEINGRDVLPEYLVTQDLQELVDQGLVQVTSQTAESTSLAVDLTNPRFKLKHVKVFRDSTYRVNPVAVLMSTDEIPHVQAHRSETPNSEDTTPANISQTQHRALRKTPKPKPKRKQTLRAISHTDKQTYVLDENFGNDKRQSRLHVKFQCSAEQSKLVEWLRGRGSELFDLEEFSRGDGLLVSQGNGPARCEESARSLLRFLHFVGYVTQV